MTACAFDLFPNWIMLSWPQSQVRDLLPDRMLAAHPELYAGDPDALPIPSMTRTLPR